MRTLLDKTYEELIKSKRLRELKWDIKTKEQRLKIEEEQEIHYNKWKFFKELSKEMEKSKK